MSWCTKPTWEKSAHTSNTYFSRYINKCAHHREYTATHTQLNTRYKSSKHISKTEKEKRKETGKYTKQRKWEQQKTSIHAWIQFEIYFVQLECADNINEFLLTVWCALVHLDSMLNRIGIRLALPKIDLWLALFTLGGVGGGGYTVFCIVLYCIACLFVCYLFCIKASVLVHSHTLSTISTLLFMFFMFFIVFCVLILFGGWYTMTNNGISHPITVNFIL